MYGINGGLIQVTGESKIVEPKRGRRLTFRSGSISFEREFADFLIDKPEDRRKLSNCTFVRSDDDMKSRALCSFQRSR